ncbi:MAG TPA: hypothetical protein VGL40_03515 [Bacillota bacterium]
MRRANLEELGRTVAGLSGQVQRLTEAMTARRLPPGDALLAAFRLERATLTLARRLRAVPDPGDPAAARLLAAAEETSALLTEAVRRVRAEVAAGAGAGAAAGPAPVAPVKDGPERG